MSEELKPPAGAPAAAPEGEGGADGEQSPPGGLGQETVHGPRRWGRLIVLWLALLVAVAGVALTQTPLGQRVVLDTVQGIADRALAGGLEIGAIRSGTLLTGASLADVRLTDPSGAQALTADSLVIHYWPMGLLFGRPRFRSVVLWGLTLAVESDAAAGGTNLDRVFRGTQDRSAPDSAAAPVLIEIGRLGARDGRITISSTDPSKVGDDIVFDGVDLDLEDAVLDLSGPQPFRARLASLSTAVDLPRRPGSIMLQEAFGVISFDAQGISVQDGAFRLQETLLNGQIRVGPRTLGEAWVFSADLESEGWGDLADLFWIDERIPPGAFRGRAEIAAGQDLDLTLQGIEIQLEASSVLADGDIRFGSEMVMQSLSLTASPLALSRIEPWIKRDIPLEGWLSGRGTFSGTVDDVVASGRVTIVPTGLGGNPTTVEFTGGLQTGEEFGATQLEVRIDPLNYRLAERFLPDVPLSGSGRGSFELDGRAGTALTLDADFTYDPADTDPSRALVRGTFGRSESGEWEVDLSGDLRPFSVDALSGLFPDLGLRGAVSGPVRAAGRLRDLGLSGVLETGEGRLSIDGALDLRAPGSWYRLDVMAEALSLAGLSDRLPDPSVWSGSISLEGRGISPDSVEGGGRLTAFASRLGGLQIDTVSAVVSASGGVLIADTLLANLGGIEVTGDGRFGLRPGADGEAKLKFLAESLIGLRPLLMGDSLLVRDDLSPLDQEFLRFQGIDPDTLPLEADVRVAGALTGDAEIAGTIDDFSVQVAFDLVGGAYGADHVDSLRVDLLARGLPGLRGRWDVDGEGLGVVWEGRSFERASLLGTMRDRAGEGAVELSRGASEHYQASGTFDFDEQGGEVTLIDGRGRINDRTWNVQRPAGIAWTSSTIQVDGLEVTRPGDDPMRLTADGILSRGGDSDFKVDIEGLHLESVARALQLEAVGLGGHLDVRMALLGAAENPALEGTFEVIRPRYGDMAVDRLGGSIDYADRLADVRVEAFDGSRNALHASGLVPIDLGLGEVTTRFLNDSLDVTITADSLSAAVAMAFLTSLEDVDGSITGDVQVLGTTRDPRLEGSVTLADAAWTIQALGLRHSGVSGSLTLTPDQVVNVQLATDSNGRSRVSGTVTLETLADPLLDLDVAFERFEAIQRRDLEGWISGAFTLGGSYRRPLVEGSLTVDEGTLFVEEFTRAAGVVDLTDPRLFGQGLAVDTTIFVTQPIFAGVRNPFLQNLRVDIDMSVPRRTWLRSGEMNVEMGGDLIVRYDRSAGDFVLVGELQALRGTYRVVGRTFDVDEGTVGFIGRPGVNPVLDLQATTRIRRREEQALEVSARVEGTLIQPLVTLSSTEPGLSQSDLMSYIVFGQATGELGATQQSLLPGAGAMDPLASTLATGGITWATGQLANQFGAVLAQGLGLGLDYLSVSSIQGQQAGLLAAPFQNTQLEMGRYVADDLFVVVVFRPVVEGDVGRFGGVRLEWAMTEDYSFEGFVEDQFLRSGAGGFGASTLDDKVILGVFLFRDWGYN